MVVQATNDTLNGVVNANNIIEGGADFDVVEYGGVHTGYDVRILSNGSIKLRDTLPNTHGNYGTDILTGIEKINFTSGGIYGVVTGTGGNDNLTSTQYWSLIYGGDGNDTINGGIGNDTINGGIGNDIIHGGTGDDIIYDSAGNDTINGGADGFDVVEYGGVYSDYDVRILSNGSIELRDTSPNTNGDYGTDILTEIEEISFKSGGEILVYIESAENSVNDAWNLNDYDAPSLVYSGAGNDTINGGDGLFDIIHGGIGNDIISGGRGADDVLTGGTGMDSFVFNSVADGVDTITDFNSTESDLIKINRTGFGGITNTNDFSFNSSDHTLSFKLNPIAILQGVTTFNVATDIVLF